MARASVDVQTDINNTQKNISDLDDQINSCNAEIQNLETRIAAVSYTHLTLPTTPYV